jgi:hypothetical protein
MLTKKKHICPNRSSNNNKSAVAIPANSIDNKAASKSPKYYNNNYKNNYNNNFNYKKSWNTKTDNKQPMDNSLEILQGPADTIRIQYEILSDLLKEYNGKTHGSQSHIDANNSIQLIVYYEVPEGMREEIERTFEYYSKN